MGNLEVKQWFDNGKDYAAGVLLYEKIGKNKLLLRNFKRNNSVANQKKLEYEFSKFLPKIVPIEKVTAEKLILEPKVDLEKVVEVNVLSLQEKQQNLLKQLPDELRPVLLKANLYYKEWCLLKLQLNDLPDEAEEEALAIQFKIIEKRTENELCWKQIDYWLEHKQLPSPAKNDFDGLNGAQLAKRQQYHFQNISKLKSRIEENKKVLENTESVGKKAVISRRIAKQESSLLAKEEELKIINKLVDGKE